jgi:hypothetical protein
MKLFWRRKVKRHFPQRRQRGRESFLIYLHYPMSEYYFKNTCRPMHLCVLCGNDFQISETKYEPLLITKYSYEKVPAEEAGVAERGIIIKLLKNAVKIFFNSSTEMAEE